MKKFILSLVLFASTINAGHKTEDRPSIILVIAFNPVFPGGVIVTTSLSSAEAVAEAWSNLDPLCQAVPEVCIARYNGTVYEIFYNDGSKEII